MQLVPFESHHAGKVSGWAPTPPEVEAWCSLNRAPVSAAAIRAWSIDPAVHAYVLAADDSEDVVAYGELWIDDADAEVELAHLIVEPERRDNGIGRTLVEMLTVRAREWYPRVVLRVRAENVSARRCYISAGFVRAAPSDERVWNQNQPHPYVWMLAEPM